MLNLFWRDCGHLYEERLRCCLINPIDQVIIPVSYKVAVISKLCKSLFTFTFLDSPQPLSSTLLYSKICGSLVMRTKITLMARISF